MRCDLQCQHDGFAGSCCSFGEVAEAEQIPRAIAGEHRFALGIPVSRGDWNRFVDDLECPASTRPAAKLSRALLQISGESPAASRSAPRSMKIRIASSIHARASSKRPSSTSIQERCCESPERTADSTGSGGAGEHRLDRLQQERRRNSPADRIECDGIARICRRTGGRRSPARWARSTARSDAFKRVFASLESLARPARSRAATSRFSSS